MSSGGLGVVISKISAVTAERSPLQVTYFVDGYMMYRKGFGTSEEAVECARELGDIVNEYYDRIHGKK